MFSSQAHSSSSEAADSSNLQIYWRLTRQYDAKNKVARHCMYFARGNCERASDCTFVHRCMYCYGDHSASVCQFRELAANSALGANSALFNVCLVCHCQLSDAQKMLEHMSGKRHADVVAAKLLEMGLQEPPRNEKMSQTHPLIELARLATIEDFIKGVRACIQSASFLTDPSRYKHIAKALMVADSRSSNEFVLKMLELLNISHDNLLREMIGTGCQALRGENPGDRHTIIEKLAYTIQQIELLELRSNQIHNTMGEIVLSNGKCLEKGILAIISSYDYVIPNDPGVAAENNNAMMSQYSSSSNSFRDISSSSSTNVLHHFSNQNIMTTQMYSSSSSSSSPSSSSFRNTSTLHHSHSNQAVASMPSPTTRQEIQKAISTYESFIKQLKALDNTMAEGSQPGTASSQLTTVQEQARNYYSQEVVTLQSSSGLNFLFNQLTSNNNRPQNDPNAENRGSGPITKLLRNGF